MAALISIKAALNQTKATPPVITKAASTIISAFINFIISTTILLYSNFYINCEYYIINSAYAISQPTIFYLSIYCIHDSKHQFQHSTIQFAHPIFIHNFMSWRH